METVTHNHFGGPLGDLAGHPITEYAVGGGSLAEPDWTAPHWQTVRRLESDGATWLRVGDLDPPFAADRLPRLAELSLSGTVLQEDPAFWSALARWQVAKRLTAVAIDCEQLPDNLLPALRSSPLTRFAASDGQVTDLHLRELLTDHGHLLTDLAVPSCGGLIDFALPYFDALPVDTPLAKLDVTDSLLATSQLGRLLASPGLARLTHLDANQAYDRGESMPSLAASDFWRQAAHLRRHSCGLDADGLRPLSVVAGPPGLRLLDLSDNRLRDAGVAMLCGTHWIHPLARLALSTNGLTDAAAVSLAERDKLTNLRVLRLSHSNITTAGAQALAASPSLSRLRLLDLSHTRIRDRGVLVLLDSPHWWLAGLGLAGCNLTFRAIDALVVSHRTRRLEWLDLSDNPNLGGDRLLPLAESPHLSRLCELDISGCGASDRVRAALRGRLGRRLSD